MLPHGNILSLLIQGIAWTDRGGMGRYPRGAGRSSPMATWSTADHEDPGGLVQAGHVHYDLREEDDCSWKRARHVEKYAAPRFHEYLPENISERVRRLTPLASNDFPHWPAIDENLQRVMDKKMAPQLAAKSGFMTGIWPPYRPRHSVSRPHWGRRCTNRCTNRGSKERPGQRALGLPEAGL